MRRLKTIKPALTRLILILAVAFVAHITWASPQRTLSPEELDGLVEQAQTAADHTKLSEHYRSEAAALEASAERHAAMGQRYRTRKNLPPKVAPAWQGMARHCSDLAKSLRAAAKASTELAASHQQMAKQLEE
jgi:hypothetical protein